MDSLKFDEYCHWTESHSLGIFLIYSGTYFYTKYFKYKPSA